MAIDGGYWEPPIHINYQHHVQEINKAVEGEIMKAVVKVGVDVDKERLLKALMDAKSFYEEGYADGKRNSVVHGRWENITIAVVDTTGYCGVCGKQAVWRSRNKPYAICPNCGAKMDLQGE